MKWTIAFISLVLFSCELFEKKDDDDKSLDPQPNERMFWVLDHTKNRGEAGRFYQLDTYKAYDDSTTIIYAQSNPNLLTEENADKIGKEFTSFIKPKVEEIYGQSSDIDGNGRIILLIFDIKDGATSGGGFIGGYFYNADMFSQASLNSTGNSDIKSNEAEVLYIDSKQQNPASTSALHTIAHEYQHLLNFALRSSSQDTWINEGLSEATEFELYGQTALSNRLGYMESTQFNLSKSLIHWDKDDALSNYSLSATFMNFASNQAGDAAARKTFLSNVQKYTAGDYQAISNELTNNYTGTDLTEKFKKIYHHYVRSGLVKVEAGAFVSTNSTNFSGIRFSTSNSYSDKGFVPRVLKYNDGDAITLSGSSYKFYDLEDNTYNELSTTSSLQKFENNNYGLVLLSNFQTNPDLTPSSTITTPLTSKRGKKAKNNLTNASFRMDNVQQIDLRKKN